MLGADERKYSLSALSDRPPRFGASKIVHRQCASGCGGSGRSPEALTPRCFLVVRRKRPGARDFRFPSGGFRTPSGTLKRPRDPGGGRHLPPAGWIVILRRELRPCDPAEERLHPVEPPVRRLAQNRGVSPENAGDSGIQVEGVSASVRLRTSVPQMGPSPLRGEGSAARSEATWRSWVRGAMAPMRICVRNAPADGSHPSPRLANSLRS